MFNGLFKRKPTPSPTAATEVSAIDSKRFPKSKRWSPVAPASTSTPAPAVDAYTTRAPDEHVDVPQASRNLLEPVPFEYNKDPDAAPAPSYEQGHHTPYPQPAGERSSGRTSTASGHVPGVSVGRLETGIAGSAVENVEVRGDARISRDNMHTATPRGDVECPPAYDEVIDGRVARGYDSLEEMHRTDTHMSQIHPQYASGIRADTHGRVDAGHDGHNRASTLFHVPQAQNASGYTAHTHGPSHPYSTHAAQFSSQPSPYPTPYPAYLTPFARDSRAPQSSPYPDTPAQQPQLASSASEASFASSSSSSLASSHQHPQLHARSYPIFTPHTPQMPHTPYTPPSLQHLQPHTYSHHPVSHPVPSNTTHVQPLHSASSAHARGLHTQLSHTHVQHTSDQQYHPHYTPQHRAPAHTAHRAPQPHPQHISADNASPGSSAAAVPAPACVYAQQPPHGSAPHAHGMDYTQTAHATSSNAAHHSSLHAPQMHAHQQGSELVLHHHHSRGDVAHQTYNSGDVRGYVQQQSHHLPPAFPGPPGPFQSPFAPHRMGHGPPRLPPHEMSFNGLRGMRRERRRPGPPLLPRLPRLAPLQGLAQGLGQLLNIGGNQREDRAERKARERAEKQAAKQEKRERKDRERQEKRDRREARRGHGSTSSYQSVVSISSNGSPITYSHEPDSYPAGYSAALPAAYGPAYTAYGGSTGVRTHEGSGGMHVHNVAHDPGLVSAATSPSPASSTSSTTSTTSSGMSGSTSTATRSAVDAGLAAAYFPSPSALQYSRLTAASSGTHSTPTQPRLSQDTASRGVPVPLIAEGSVAVQTGVAHTHPQQTLSELALTVPTVGARAPSPHGAPVPVKADTSDDPELGKTVSVHSPQWERLPVSAADTVELASPLSPTGTVTAQAHIYIGGSATAASVGAASVQYLQAPLVVPATAVVSHTPSSPQLASAVASEGLYNALPAADIADDFSFAADGAVDDARQEEGDDSHNDGGDAPPAIALWRVDSIRESRGPTTPLRTVSLRESIAYQDNGLMTPEADLFPAPSSLLHAHDHAEVYPQDEWVLAASNTALYAGVPVLPDDICPVNSHNTTCGAVSGQPSMPPMSSACLPSPSTLALPHSLASGLGQSAASGSFAQALHSSAGDARANTVVLQRSARSGDINTGTATGTGGLTPAYVTVSGVNWESAAERRPVDGMQANVTPLHMEHQHDDMYATVESPLQIMSLRAHDIKASDICEGEEPSEREDSTGSTQDSEECGRSDATSFSFFTSPPSTSPVSSGPSSTSPSTPAPTQPLARAASHQAPSPHQR